MCLAQVAQFAGIAAQAGSSALQGSQNADTLNANADVLDLKADDALTRGGISEDIQRNKTAQTMGFQRAAMGASGVQVDSGSFGKVQEQTAAMGEFDAQTIRSNSMREAWNYSTEAANARQQAMQAGQLGRLLMPGGIKGAFFPTKETIVGVGSGGILNPKGFQNYISTGKRM